ncbi:formin-J [Anopheles cruzii]|uniref:formin-J n=1 Tax=Anopheles cruzii TaxID=68878 RepID=UPI0022EC6FDA|nr:formin-J [Anopheles cruzii]
MGKNSPGTPKKCRLILQQCLAIQLTKPGSPPEDFWMYDSGYTIFQNFLSANLQCWWNAPLAAATKVLKYLGHIAPGMLLITAEPCALEIIRSAYARSVLKPPATYLISSVGDIDDCIVTPIVQTQFTPLTEALCDVIMELTSQGQSATVENIRNRLRSRFTHMQQPSVEVIYDTLVQLMQEIKIYQTSKGYFIVTPEKRRNKAHHTLEYSGFPGDLDHSGSNGPAVKESKTLLMSSHEALSSLYGEISTERAGDQTHQCIQTNLADVICGGNPNDKILYARPTSGIGSSKFRSSSFPSNGKTLERRHSLRFFGSSKRLQRSSSTRSLSKNYAQTIGKDGTVTVTGPANGATGTMGAPTTATGTITSEMPSATLDAKKQASSSSQSLLSRIFRRSTRSKSKTKQLETYSAQFPPPEWFNSKTTHLHSVGTQTTDYLDFPIKSRRLLNSTFYDSSDVSQRSLSLPRRRQHHRRNLSSESTFFISSRDCSPVRRGKSPASYYCGSLPRSIHSTPGSGSGGSSSYYKASRSKQLTSADPLLHGGSNPGPAKLMEHHAGGRPGNHTSRHPAPGSGPSSIDSGKMTYVTTSGPSSFDSEKLSSTRTSTHSSLESHVSSSTITTAIQQQASPARVFEAKPPSIGSASSPSRSAAKPLSSPGIGTVTTVMTTAVASSTTTKANNNNHNNINNNNNNSYKCFETTFGYSSTGGSSKRTSPSSTVSNSSSNSSSKSTTPSGAPPPPGGGHRISLTKPIDHLAALSESLLQFRLSGEAGENRTPDSSLSGDGTPVIRTIPIQTDPAPTGTIQELNRYNKNSTMNNSKVMQGSAPPVPNFFYKNVLKNIQHDSKNICGDLATEKTRYDDDWCGGGAGIGAGSNLRRSNSEIKKLNSNVDPPPKHYTGLLGSPKHNGTSYHRQSPLQQQQEQPAAPQQRSGLIVMKKSLSVSSEPNLLGNGDTGRSQITILVKEEKNGGLSQGPAGKDRAGGKPGAELDRRFSFQSRDEAAPELLEEMYEFPSLSDLSFNFTSLAAQKILQGDASLNSIDTLVELNINQEKQQTLMRLKNDACLLAAASAPSTVVDAGDSGPKVMTDFGMV